MGKKLFLRFIILYFVIFTFQKTSATQSRGEKNTHHSPVSASKKSIKYGIASYYANKFKNHSTASGERYSHQKFTAACNSFPLHKWIKVTNLRNHKSVILQINDRMNRKNNRLVDVSQSAAKKLGFISRGTARVKVELLYNYPK